MSESLPKVFDDKIFWLKVGVDYEEAEETVANSEDEVDSLADELLNRFVKRKRAVITDRYDSIEHFRTVVKQSTDAETELLRIFAEMEWYRKTDGTEFRSEEEAVEVITDLTDDSAVVRETVNEEFEILWGGNSHILKEIDKETEKIDASKRLEATPIVIKKTGNGFEVRGTGKHKNQIVSEFKEKDELTEEEPDSISESVIGQFGDLLDGANDHFKITGVKLSHSDLPRQSKLTVKNEDAVYADISELRRKDVVSFEGVSELHTLFLRDLKLGNNFRIRIKQGEDGFRLVLKALNSKDYERENFKDTFTQLTGIEFDTIYEYSSQDERYLFNRILTGSSSAYRQYFSVLDEDVQQQLEEFIEASSDEFRSCTEDGCNALVDATEEECPKCGSEHLTDKFEQVTVDVRQERIRDTISDILDAEPPSHTDLDLSKWMLNSMDLSSRPVVESRFSKIDHSGNGRITNEELYFIPQGGGQRPGRVNEYLLDAVYVTYGGAAGKNYPGYGQIQLYDLLFTEDTRTQVGTAVIDTATGLRDRLRSRARGAHEAGKKYFEIVDRYGSITECKERLKEIYDPSHPNYFEKHIFYMLKDMFVLSERWGKEGERLSDGALICPLSDGEDYYVASYDAKLSHRKDGYPLSSEIEDQATRYILTNQDRSSIENKTDDKGPYSHIFISQNLRRSQFPKAAENIRENQDLFSGDISTDVVYMEYQALLNLHKVYMDYWRAFQDSRVANVFFRAVTEELQKTEPDEDFIHFNSDSVSEIRSQVVERLDRSPDGAVLPYSEQ